MIHFIPNAVYKRLEIKLKRGTVLITKSTGLFYLNFVIKKTKRRQGWRIIEELYFELCLKFISLLKMNLNLYTHRKKYFLIKALYMKLLQSMKCERKK